MDVSLFVHDLAANSIVRAYPIGEALKRAGYTVEYLGFLIGADQVYPPFEDEVDAKVITVEKGLAEVPRRAAALARQAKGNIIYAFKPLWTSFWPALLASRFGQARPLVLDVEDNDVWGWAQPNVRRAAAAALRGWSTVASKKWAKILHPATRLAHEKTVVSTTLQQMYGGTLLRQGPDHTRYDPRRSDLQQESCRRALRLPAEVPLLLFAGRPAWYKGLDVVVEALEKYNTGCHLVLCGDATKDTFLDAKQKLKERCHLLGYRSNAEMPKVLAAVDIVPVLQQPTPYTQAQVPAKLLEAMAMEKAVIATPVSDLASILGKNGKEASRGWLVEERTARHVARAVDDVTAHPARARERCEQARAFFIENVSVEANARVLSTLFERLLR